LKNQLAKMRQSSSKMEAELEKARKTIELLKTVEFVIQKNIKNCFRKASLNAANLKINRLK